MGMEKESEIMLTGEASKTVKRRCLRAVYALLLEHVARPIFLPHATERERPMSVLSLICSNIYRSGRLYYI